MLEIRDVTEEKRSEQEKLNALKKAEEEQRRRAQEAESHQQKQERFIDTICHEIRNPLCGIYGSVVFLYEELEQLKSLVNQEIINGEIKSQITERFTQLRSCVDAIDKCSHHQVNSHI